MALTVEDGTGLADADALKSLEYVTTYHAAAGNDAWFRSAPVDQEAAIRRASTYLTHSLRWKGYRLNGRSQALAWPRTGVYDPDGYEVPSDEVPDEVAQALAEIALRELGSPGAMTREYDPTAERVKSERVGEIAVEYDLPSRRGAVQPILPLVTDLLAGLLVNGGSSAVQWLARA